MQKSGLINKMQVSLVNGQAQYQLPIGDNLLAMNGLIGQQLLICD